MVLFKAHPIPNPLVCPPPSWAPLPPASGPCASSRTSSWSTSSGGWTLAPSSPAPPPATPSARAVGVVTPNPWVPFLFDKWMAFPPREEMCVKHLVPLGEEAFPIFKYFIEHYDFQLFFDGLSTLRAMPSPLPVPRLHLPRGPLEGPRPGGDRTIAVGDLGPLFQWTNAPMSICTVTPLGSNISSRGSRARFFVL